MPITFNKNTLRRYSLFVNFKYIHFAVQFAGIHRLESLMARNEWYDSVEFFILT